MPLDRQPRSAWFPFLLVGPLLASCGLDDVTADPDAVSVQAQATREGQHAVVSVTASALDGQGNPIAGVQPSVELVVGIDVILPVPLEETEPGVYAGEVMTEFAGPASVRAEIDGDDTVPDVVEALAVPPGAIEYLDVTVDGWALGDGSSTLEVVVSATDIVGNPGGREGAELVIETELPYELFYNDCDEAVVRFTAPGPGLFPLAVTEVQSGLSVETELPFLLAGTGRPRDAVFSTAIGESRPLAVPVSASVPTEWEATDAWLELSVDPGMVTIGGTPELVDTDPDDCIHPTVELYPSELDPGGLSGFINLAIDPAGTQGCERKPVFESELLFATSPEPASEDIVEGGVRVDAFESTVVHPITADLRWINDLDIAAACICENLPVVHKGCIVYARAPLPEGQPHYTDKEICEAHDVVNEDFRQANASFDKRIQSGILSGDDVSGPLKKTDKIEKALTEARKQANADGCLLVLIVDSAEAKALANEELGAVAVTTAVFGNERSLSHEIGHTLGLDHSAQGVKDRKQRLMTPTDGGKGVGSHLTDPERAKVRQSDWLKKEGGLTYRCL